jgi:hypothetical protein
MNRLEKQDLINEIRGVLADLESEKEFYCEAEVTVQLELTFRLEDFSTMVEVPTAKLVDLSSDGKIRLVIEGDGAEVDEGKVHDALENAVERKLSNMDGDDFARLAQQNGEFLVTDYTLDGIVDVVDNEGEEL